MRRILNSLLSVSEMWLNRVSRVGYITSKIPFIARPWPEAESPGFAYFL